MGEVNQEFRCDSISSQYAALQIVTVPLSSREAPPSINNGVLNIVDQKTIESWLPITESKKGNFFTAFFHLLASGIGFQALMLPAAFVTLGWVWGVVVLSVAFIWQLYTMWLLVQLHEPYPGTTHSRYLHLLISSFGPKLGKLLGVFPLMYLSGGTCCVLIIVGGGAMKQAYHILCDGGGGAISGTEWFLIFTCIAFAIAMLPNLNSLSSCSLVAAISSIGLCTLIWVLAIKNGKQTHDDSSKNIVKNGFVDIMNALGMIVLSFRGHNVVLEIQGTLPSNSKYPSHKIMWRAVLVSYFLVACCHFPLAIATYWAYGNHIPSNGGMLSNYLLFYGKDYSKAVNCAIHSFVIISSLGSFQIYIMLVFDNLEFIYIKKNQQRCPIYVRVVIRLLFGGFLFFMSVTFPFLPKLGVLVGGLALPVAFGYPCFMWIMIMKPKPKSVTWFLNWVLGWLGVCLSGVVLVAAGWNLKSNGLHANFYDP